MLHAALAVALGGALGSLARFVTVTLTQQWLGSRFPIGTFLVNSIGAYLIGFLMSFMLSRYALQAEVWRLFLVVGFLGAYTTFSSFTWETWILFNNGEWTSAILNVVLTNLSTLFLVLLGIQSSRLLERV